MSPRRAERGDLASDFVRNSNPGSLANIGRLAINSSHQPSGYCRMRHEKKTSDSWTGATKRASNMEHDRDVILSYYQVAGAPRQPPKRLTAYAPPPSVTAAIRRSAPAAKAADRVRAASRTRPLRGACSLRPHRRPTAGHRSLAGGWRPRPVPLANAPEARKLVLRLWPARPWDSVCAFLAVRRGVPAGLVPGGASSHRALGGRQARPHAPPADIKVHGFVAFWALRYSGTGRSAPKKPVANNKIRYFVYLLNYNSFVR